MREDVERRDRDITGDARNRGAGESDRDTEELEMCNRPQGRVYKKWSTRGAVEKGVIDGGSGRSGARADTVFLGR